MYPSPPIYSLHNLQGHSLGAHLFILAVNSLRCVLNFISFGIRFQTLGPKSLKESLP